MASCRTDGETPEASPTATVITARAFAVPAAARADAAVAGPEIAAGTTPMRHTKQMSMLTARLFNALCLEMSSLNTHIRGSARVASRTLFSLFYFSTFPLFHFFQFST